MLKKIIINITIVALVVFVLDFTIGRVLRFFYFKESSGLHFRTTLAMETTKADIIVFGSSRANHHYVPDVFEDSLKMSFYNTGRDGNGIFFQTAVLKSIIKRYAPKIIIFDYYATCEKGAEDYDRLSSLLPYYRTHKEIRDIVELKSPYEKVKLLSEIYPFNSQILTIAIGNLEINKKRYIDNKGYVALHREWEKDIDSSSDFNSYNIDLKKLSSFQEFITVSKKSGAKVYIVYSPIFQNYDRIQEIDICNNISNSQKIPFFDLSRDTIFLRSKQLFYDIQHLNHNGAELFSKLVVQKIKLDYENIH